METPNDKLTKVLVGELDRAGFVGKLSDIIAFLTEVQQRYEKDYQELELDFQGNLFGVRNYSDATLNKLQQLRSLLQELPEEAAQTVLHNCLQSDDDPNGAVGT